MGKVARLSDSLINQIAAGEVVERPASVLKELAENSIDAHARVVRIDLVEGGLQRIAVSDDGEGMSPEDARLCLERHATSKLHDLEGLSHLDTMGFRGEALPSIASVSRLTLTTRTANAVAATRLRLEGGRLVEEGEVGAPAGTQVVVEDLFFNTPARRKFAKRAETEWGHCSEAVLRLALARADIGFFTTHNGRPSFSAPATSDLRERIAASLSPELYKHLIPITYRSSSLSIAGYATSPEFSLSTNRGLHLFVNRRFIRDRALLHAIGRAYQNVLPAGRQPAAVLYLEVPLDSVDVNVHPQKLEVRFADARAIADAVVDAIRSALRTSPWLRHDSEETGPSSQFRRAGLPRPGVPIPGPSWAPTDPADHDARWMEASLPLSTAPGETLPAVEFSGEPTELGDGAAAGYFASLRYIGQLSRTYLVCEAPGGTLVLIDQHAAHERLRFDQLRKQHTSGTLPGQPFLFPMQVTLSLPDARALLDHAGEVATLGLELEAFGGDTLALKSVPALLVGVDYTRLLNDLAQEFAQVGRGEALDEALNHLLATMACHSAVRANQTLSPEEVRALLNDLDRVDFKTRCPHGRPVAAELHLADIERRVHRR